VSDMVKIRYSIEGPAVQLGGYHDEIEIDEDELPPRDDPEARGKAIGAFVEAEVENAVQWGWEEA
jgi:hypothetical protein